MKLANRIGAAVLATAMVGTLLRRRWRLRLYDCLHR